MGVGISWEPVKRGKSLNVGLRSKFLAALQGECGSAAPIYLREQHLGFLRGLAAAEPSFKEPVDELVDAISKHDEIRIWWAY